MLTTLLAAASLLASDPARLAPPPPSAGETSGATAEGTEILRRLLAGALDDAFQDKKKTDAITLRQTERLHGIVTALWTGNQTVEHSRGFHLPDVGLFFSIDANLPVVEKELATAQKGDPEEDPRDDEWERARREVRGDGSATRFRVQLPRPTTETRIDPAAIERTSDTVLGTLARHAGRVEGLTGGETITVALRLGGRDSGAWHDLGEAPLAGFHVLGEDEPEKGLPDEEGDEDGKFSLFSRYVIAGTQPARSQNLVIRVSLSGLSGPDTSVERLRQRAQINLY